MTSQVIDDLDLGALQLFLGAVELGSVSKAAARTGITQPSATARLQKLERQLGTSLLERGPTGSVPTEAGEALLSACGDLLTSARRLVDLAHDRREAGDTLRLAATRTAIEHVLPQRVGGSPLDGVTVELSELDTLGVAGAVRDGRAAMGLCDGPLAPIGLRSEVVATIELALVVGPRHPFAGRHNTSVRASELLATALIMRTEGSGTRDVIEALLAPHGFDPIERRIEVPSNAAARLAAVNGSGVAILPLDQVATDLSAGRLTRLMLRGITLEQPVRVVWKGTQPATEAARRLRAVLSGR